MELWCIHTQILNLYTGTCQGLPLHFLCCCFSASFCSVVVQHDTELLTGCSAWYPNKVFKIKQRRTVLLLSSLWGKTQNNLISSYLFFYFLCQGYLVSHDNGPENTRILGFPWLDSRLDMNWILSCSQACLIHLEVSKALRNYTGETVGIRNIRQLCLVNPIWSFCNGIQASHWMRGDLNF